MELGEGIGDVSLIEITTDEKRVIRIFAATTRFVCDCLLK
jgi:hypothetical protein